MKELLLTYPLLKGIGVSVGERISGNLNSTLPDDRELTGEYSIENWIWKTYGLGIMDAREVQPGRHVNFIFRKLGSDLSKIRKAFADYPDTFETSYKYSFARIYTTTNPPFFDQEYRTDVERNQMKSWMNLRNDDILVHRWGDPDHVRKFLVNLPHDVMAGFYMGSDGYVPGREFTSLDPEQPRQLEIRKHWYRFMLWGRLAYDPTLDRDFFENTLADRFPGVDASLLYDTWSASSGIVPQLNRFYWFVNDRQWAPEAGIDMLNGYHSVNRFIDYEKRDNSILDHAGTLTIEEYTESFTSGTDRPGVTPLEVAFNLDRFAERALAGVSTLREDHDLSKELRKTLTDIESMSHLGRYYAGKIRRAGCHHSEGKHTTLA